MISHPDHGSRPGGTRTDRNSKYRNTRTPAGGAVTLERHPPCSDGQFSVAEDLAEMAKLSTATGDLTTSRSGDAVPVHRQKCRVDQSSLDRSAFAASVRN
jgi:hypothetical protein